MSLFENSIPAGSIGGLKIITSIACKEQWRFPTTKKRRIRNKWAKRPKNWRPARKVFVDSLNDVVYCHPAMEARLRESLKEGYCGV